MDQPRTIGRYRIERQLAKGGMALVYLAQDPAMRRQVAIKLLPRRLTLDSEFLHRFRREAETIARLEHPAIVPVYDFGDHDGQPFIVMRYMPGGTLADRIAKGPISPRSAAKLLKRLAPALDEAHSSNIVHRDIKPGNILFDSGDRAYLTDFGIVKITGDSVTAYTASGSAVGTPAYMSPEQVTGAVELDGRSDIYSLGVVLFEMLTGKQPFEAQTPAVQALQHVTEPIPQILSVNQALPPGCQVIIERAMAKDRDQRYPTAAAMAAAVDRLRPLSEGRRGPRSDRQPAKVVARPPEAEATPASPPEPLDKNVESPGRSRRNLTVFGLLAGLLIVAVVCAAAAYGGYSLWMGQNNPTPTAGPTGTSAATAAIPATAPSSTPDALETDTPPTPSIETPPPTADPSTTPVSSPTLRTFQTVAAEASTEPSSPASPSNTPTSPQSQPPPQPPVEPSPTIPPPPEPSPTLPPPPS